MIKETEARSAQYCMNDLYENQSTVAYETHTIDRIDNLS